MNLKDKAKQLPSSPGVYLWKDSADSIIYVGKSKNLKNRVLSYLQKSKSRSRKVEKMVKHIRDFDYIRTDTEFEAFMLECKLIKELQPMYNRVMKSPRSYTYIMIKMNQELYRMELSDRIKEHESIFYFGPYTSKNTAINALDRLKTFYKLDCSNQTGKNAPCLNYSLGLCRGMCFKRTAIEVNNQIISRIRALLEGRDTSILEELEQKMIAATNNFEFEKATEVRDCMAAVKSLIHSEKMIEFTKANKNIAAIEFIGESKLKLFLITGNKVLFKQIYEIEDSNVEQQLALIKSEIAATFTSKSTQPSNTINKEEIDEAKIIYSYLKNNACHYLIIPDEWLEAEKYDKLEEACNAFLTAKLISNLPLS